MTPLLLFLLWQNSGRDLPLIVEDESRISSAYGITGVPETFVIDPDGYVAYIHIGPVDAETLMSELADLMKMD